MTDTTDITGWKSRFDIALQTRHRIVLYGNTEDAVLEGGEAGPLTDWLRRRLERAGITRILRYNHAEEPQVLAWDGDNAEEMQRRLPDVVSPPAERGSAAPRRDPSDPLVALRLLGSLLRLPGSRTGVIVENAQYRYDEPSVESVLLRQLKREFSDTASAAGVVIHVYTHESRIPPDFFKADPDTSIVLISLPSYEERKAFFERMAPEARVLHATELGVRIGAGRLARLTEGYRLRELDQIAALAADLEQGADISGLISRMRHGRREDYWAQHQIPEIREALHKAVRGQGPAIDQVIEAVYKAKHHVGRFIDESASTPAMVLFFVGATGVGKTHMARALCVAVTGTEESLKRLDMTEYQQEHSDQRLIGPPPGYVGHLEGGQLTNWVLERPYSVVLIDEVEKAHPRILDKFMQILEGARLTDGKGQTVDLSETILIFTSNIGGIDADEERLDRGDRVAVDAYFRRQVERYFDEDLERPEIFNRLKRGVVVFDYITESLAGEVMQDRLRQIAAGVRRRLGDRLQIHFNPADPEDQQVAAALLGRTNFTKYGLRDVNNVLYEDVGGPLAIWLDGHPEGADWRYFWNATREKVEIRPARG